MGDFWVGESLMEVTEVESAVYLACESSCSHDVQNPRPGIPVKYETKFLRNLGLRPIRLKPQYVTPTVERAKFVP